MPIYSYATGGAVVRHQGPRYSPALRVPACFCVLCHQLPGQAMRRSKSIMGTIGPKREDAPLMT